MIEEVSFHRSRPILFSGSMVNAILEGRKAQSRRVVKPLCGCPDFYDYNPKDPYPYYFRRKDAIWDSFKTIDELVAKYCPYGKNGDYLWVRETWGVSHSGDILFRADGRVRPAKGWKPSIHMPRKASRLLLKIQEISLERLEEVSEEDAIAEGVESTPNIWSNKENVPLMYRDYSSGAFAFSRAKTSFSSLWDSINASRGLGWLENPYVFVIRFERVQ